MMKKILEERSMFFFAICIVLLQVFVFSPSSIWTHNQFNFDSSYSDSLKIVFIIVFAILVVSLLITLISPRVVQKLLFPFFVLLSVLVFIQQNVLVWNYGILDGKSLKFSANDFLGYIDTGIWIFAFVFFILKRNLFIKYAGTILTFSCTVAISVFVISLYSYDFNNNKNSASFTEDKKFVFSKEKNILVFVLDGFQSDLFWQIIENEPSIQEDLRGFTFYPNTTAVFSKTYPSIPLLLTGEIYQKKQPIRDYLDGVYKNSVLSEFIDSNWNVGLYPYLKNMIPINDSYLSNYTDKITLLNKIESYLQALDLSFFRSAPHVFKKTVFNNGDFYVEKTMLDFIKEKGLFEEDKKVAKKLPKTSKHRGINFLNNLKSFGSAKSLQPTFKFYHLLMPHSPFALNKNLEEVHTSNDFDSYKDYAYASLKLMTKYLQELKTIGVYDNSAIIIVADHGGGEYTNKKYDVENRKFEPINIDGKEKASAKPLLLVKEFNAKKPFSIQKNKPLSLTDVATTVASFAKIKNPKKGGMVINEISKLADRERLFYYYNFSGWDSKYLQDFHIYQINGNIYNQNSWSKKGILKAKKMASLNHSKYTLNKTITYGKDLKYNSDFQNRFIADENFKLRASSLYSFNQEINLSIPISEPIVINSLYRLELNVSTSKGDGEITVGFNKEVFKLIRLETINDRQFIFLQASNRAPSNIINIKLIPSVLLNNNQVLLSMMKITKINLSQIGNGSVIKLSDDLENFQLSGFLEKRKWGRWSSKKKSSLIFKAAEDFCQKGFVLLNLRKFYANVNPEKFKVFINNDLLKIIKKEKFKYYYQCPSNAINPNDIVKLSFETNTVVSPLEANEGTGRRKLGFGLRSIQFGKLRQTEN